MGQRAQGCYMTDNDNDFPQLTASLAEAGIHGLLTAVGSDYVKLLKKTVLPQLNLPKPYTVRDLQILNTLYTSAKALTSTDVFRRTFLDPATVTRSTKQMINDGFILAEENESDSRSRFLTLSKSGRTLARTYNEKCQALFESKDLTISAPALQDIEKLERSLKSLQNRVKILSLKNFKG